MKTKFLLALTILNFGILPTFAKMDGRVSQDFFYDTEKTIMTELAPSKTLSTQKYWDQNVIALRKYRPMFMLANKELYNLMPRENVSVVQRISTPSVYNISLKTASITPVSLNPTAKKPTQPAVNKQISQKSNSIWASLYEQAKSPDADSEKRLETAILLKDSKSPQNYYMAIDLLNDVTKKEPYNAYAFYLKGELYASQKKPETAMQNYVEALKINPTSKQSCLGIAKILEPTNKALSQKYYAMSK